MKEDKNLIIVDSSSLLYRAYHALPPLTDKNGQATGAAYGFLLILFRAIKDVKANYLVACFDTPKPTFRHEQFAEYKAHRPKAPDDIVSQFPIIQEILKSLGIPLFAKEGFEADDLIATIAKKAEGDCSVYIVSGDLDNLQLVDAKIKLYTMGKGIKDMVVYDADKVKERFGVQPEQMNDFKALIGDSSDNIPGVPGIGKTTAADIIQRYGSLENVYSELATDTAVLKPKIKEALRANKEKAFLSRQLVETVKDVEVEFNLQEAKFGSFGQVNAIATLEKWGFYSLVPKLATIIF